MRLIEAIVFGVVQGTTEFIPVSSSAHLRVVPKIFGWADPGAGFTAVLQLGTTAAVLLAFRHDLRYLARGAARLLERRGGDIGDDARVARAVIVGSLPILLIGAVLAPVVEGPFRNLALIAVALGVGRLLPELAPHATRWPYALLGVGFALYGIAMFLLGTRRMGAFDRTTWSTSARSSEDRMLLAFMAAGTILGLGTLAVIVAQ